MAEAMGWSPGSHFSDWCTHITSADGYFGSAQTHSNFIVILCMAGILLVGVTFTFGLLQLLVIQLRNFCTGMTTMERMGSAGNRSRRQIFAEGQLPTATGQDTDDDNY